MAVGLTPPTELLPVAGIRLGSCYAGIRKAQRDDVLLIECAPGTRAAAVFTQNAFCAAPVIVAREHLTHSSTPRYLLTNAGNANSGTGDLGLIDARASCIAVAQATSVDPQSVMPFSTGVIGARLPMDKLTAAIPTCLQDLQETGWLKAAHTIMTTDTVAKGISRRIQIDNEDITLTGIAKGAGMIRPDMATMLAYIATDAGLPAERLQTALQQAVEKTFNRISVDGDTSTNDACVLLATGQAGELSEQAEQAFGQALTEVCHFLAQAIVRDGEGATKFITLNVQQGRDTSECLQVAYTIAHSPLVKTAFFASDPNWGRLLACVGRAGLQDLELQKVNIYLNEVCIVRAGGVAEDYTEEAGQGVMQHAEITVRVELGRGSTQETVWTTDLSHDYVRINAEYRT